MSAIGHVGRWPAETRGGGQTTAPDVPKASPSPPDDEHHGRGDAIRRAPRDGRESADRKRRLWHRKNRNRP
jgi:hypothetical protein